MLAAGTSVPIETVVTWEPGEAGVSPVGVIHGNAPGGFTWIIPGTNKVTLIETHDSLMNAVVRYYHDREIYGPSLYIIGGPVSTNHPELPWTLNDAAFFHTRQIPPSAVPVE